MQGGQKHILITPGEPAGIGPDLCIMLAQSRLPCRVSLVADPGLMQDRARQLGMPISLVEEIPGKSPPEALPAGTLGILPVKLRAPVTAGKLNHDNSPYVLETLRLATHHCLQGHYDALVTAPVHKGIINDAGIPFTGHTEFLAEQCKTPRVVMMLATPGLRVALATTHLPVREISNAITPTLLTEVITILHHDLVHRMGIDAPRILVCGLNPHAGEGGHLGCEEIETIEPVLESLREKGMHLYGPLPADTLFVPRYLEQADAVLAMYHDQGLPVLKHMGFGKAVNITLGLPIIRTSVDHGTALDLAGSGKADPGSLIVALQYALDMR